MNDTNVLKLLQEMEFIIILVWFSHNVNFPLFKMSSLIDNHQTKDNALFVTFIRFNIVRLDITFMLYYPYALLEFLF